MKKNIFKYLKEGFKSARKDFKNKGNIISYWLYFFSRIICLIITPLFPAACLANINVGDNSKKNVNFIESYKTVNSPKKYWNTVLGILLMILIYLSGLFLIGFITLGLVLIGEVFNNTTIYLILLIPGLIMLVIFTVIFILYLFPMIYYLNNDYSPVDSILSSISTMKNRGKVKVFLYYLFKILLIGIYAALVFGGFVLVYMTTDLAGLYAFVVVFITLYVYPYLSYGLNITKVSILRDLADGEIVKLAADDKSIDEVEIAALFNEIVK